MAEINIFRIVDRGRPQMVSYTTSTGLSWFKPFKVAAIALRPGAQNAFAFNWQNPESCQIMIHLLAINLTTASGAASTMDIGTAVATDTAAANLLDTLNINTTGWFNGYTAVSAGTPIQVVDENGGTTAWVTGQILDNTGLTLAGTIYIIYTTLDF